MTNDPERSVRGLERLRRALVTCACLCLCFTASGCRFLADEFTWLDRAAPSAAKVPDAPTTALDGRP